MDWMLRRITDYWESRTNAVLTLAGRLEPLDEDDRARELSDIAGCVERHLEVLRPEHLETVAWVMADDLYRGVTQISYWDDSIAQYLAATSRPVLRRLTRQRYSLRYFIDNEFATTPVGLAGPAEWFGVWFRAAGFAYLCPQEVAKQRIGADRRRADEWTAMLSEYLPGARDATRDALRSCRSSGGHLVYLDAESSENAAAFAFQHADDAGAITAFRNEAPHLSARCTVRVTPVAGRSVQHSNASSL